MGLCEKKKMKKKKERLKHKKKFQLGLVLSSVSHDFQLIYKKCHSTMLLEN